MKMFRDTPMVALTALLSALVVATLSLALAAPPAWQPPRTTACR